MTVQTSSISEKAAHVHAGRLVLILGSLAALGPLSVDMYLPAFPNMAGTLGTNLSSVETSLASYFAGLSFGQLFYGPLADRYGRKGPLLLGLGVYALASVACAMAQSIEAVIALRFMQALGACGGMVIPRAIVRDRFGHQESARIFSLLMLIMGVAPILAPLLGGYFSLNFGWRSIFWFLVAFSSLAIVGAGVFLPETHGSHPEHKMKGSFSTFGSILRDREFLRYTLAGSIAQAGMFAYITGSPFVFIEYFGIPADKFGWVFGSNALGLIAVSQLNARLLRTFSYEKILTVAIRIVAVAGAVLMIAGVSDAGRWAVMVPLFLYVATLGATFPNAAAGALASQGRNAGSASAMLGTLQMMAASLASLLLSKLHATSAAPMTVIVGVCGILSLLIFTVMKNRMDDKSKILLERTINGRHLTLRAPRVSDAIHVAEYWFGPASAHLLAYTDATAFGNKEDLLARTEKFFASLSHEGPWSTLVADVDGQPSGNVLINSLVPEEEALVHVHIWDPALRRTGIASRMAQDVFAYFLDAFKLKRLVLHVQTENTPVIRLLESLGLQSEGTFFGKAAPICKEGEYKRFVIKHPG